MSSAPVGYNWSGLNSYLNLPLEKCTFFNSALNTLILDPFERLMVLFPSSLLIEINIDPTYVMSASLSSSFRFTPLAKVCPLVETGSNHSAFSLSRAHLQQQLHHHLCLLQTFPADFDFANILLAVFFACRISCEKTKFSLGGPVSKSL